MLTKITFASGDACKSIGSYSSENQNKFTCISQGVSAQKITIILNKKINCLNIRSGKKEQINFPTKFPKDIFYCNDEDNKGIGKIAIEKNDEIEYVDSLDLGGYGNTPKVGSRNSNTFYFEPGKSKAPMSSFEIFHDNKNLTCSRVTAPPQGKDDKVAKTVSIVP